MTEKHPDDADGGTGPRGSQPDPEGSSDGDASWTADPITQDPSEDRSVEAVVTKQDEGA